MGAKSWRAVLAIRWRISPSEAGRRLDNAAVLGPRQTLTGQPLDPVLPATALAQAHGLINAEHVAVIREAMDRIPGSVDPITRAQMEIDWARAAVGVGPKKLKDDAQRTIFLLDQDGPEPDDRERQRRRGVTKSPQQPDGMVALKAVLTPEAWAIVEAIFAKWAAPGMCNPADDHPCLSGTPTQAQIDHDDRSLPQRQHDALMEVGRWVLKSGVLGQHNGVPATIIVRTTLQDIESRAGMGVTGGGTMMPIKDVLKLAADNGNLFLAVFDGATGSAMDLFRARRTASVAQRLMLIGRDGGCTKPDCTVGPYGTQVHHAARDWANDGQTNVDEMTLACPPDNRMVGPNGWTTRMNDQHDVEWIPPPHLDTGQTRINDYHRPERLYRPPEDTPPPAAQPSDMAPTPTPTPAEAPAPWDPYTAWDPEPDEPKVCDGASTPQQDVPAPAWDPYTAWDDPEPDQPEADQSSATQQDPTPPDAPAWDPYTAWTELPDQPKSTPTNPPAVWDPRTAWTESEPDQPEPDEAETDHPSATQPESTPTDAPAPWNVLALHNNSRAGAAGWFVARLCTRVPHHPSATEPDGAQTPRTRTRRPRPPDDLGRGHTLSTHEAPP
jgi:hypothetical protein